MRKHHQTILADECEASVTPADIQQLQLIFSPRPGCFVVAMHKEREAHGEILLPDQLKTRIRADIGTVVASGVDELLVGTVGLLQYGLAKRVSGFVSPDGREWPQELRFYGAVGGMMLRKVAGFPCEIENYEYHEAMMATIEDGILQARGTKVIVEIPEAVTEQNGILLGNAKRFPPSVIIRSVGDRCEIDAQPGEEWIWMEGAANNGDLGARIFKWGDCLYASIDWKGLVTRVN